MNKLYFKKQNIKYIHFRIILLAASAFAFLVFASEILENELVPFDSGAYYLISSGSSAGLTVLMKILSMLGSFYVLIPLSVFFVLLFQIRRKRRNYGIIVSINLVSVFLFNILFKFVFHRPRPDVAQLVGTYGYSFPSGHAMISAAFYGYLIYLSIHFLKKPWKLIVTVSLLLLISLIGISRIYLGVHYASDVIGGLLAGFGWLVLFIALTEAYQQNGVK